MSNGTIGGVLLKKFNGPYKNKNVLGRIIESEVRFLTFNEYFDCIAQLGHSLRNLGMTPQSKVSILAHTRYEWHLTDLAVMCSRAVLVPIYPNYIPSEISFILNHSESEILFVENAEQLEKIIQIQHELQTLKTLVSYDHIQNGIISKLKPGITYKTYQQLLSDGMESHKAHPEEFKSLLETNDPEEIATIIYTSGTTGEPKGAVITHKAVYTMLENVGSAFSGQFTPEDRTLTFLPLAHVFGRCDSLLHLTLNWEIVFAESIDKIIDNLALVKPTIMLAVPRIFEKVYAKINEQVQSGSIVKKTIFAWAHKVSTDYYNKLENDQSPTPIEIFQKNLAYKLVFSKIYNRFGGRVRFFVSGGAPISVDIIKFLRNANLTILEGYGLTETVAPCFVNPASKQIPGTVGRPTGDVQCKIAEDGEILIKSEATLREYYKNPQATTESIKDGWFYTGDIGLITPEGYLKITDRKKDIIVTAGGKNIAPQKLENMMKSQKYISHFLAIGDKRKFLVGIVAIEKERFVKHLEQWGMDTACSIKDLTANPNVKELIQKDIDAVNEKLSRFETIKKFIIAPYEFGIESGELTPSMKLKKKEIMKRFQSEIDALYEEL